LIKNNDGFGLAIPKLRGKHSIAHVTHTSGSINKFTLAIAL